jgi:hypothetical protein
MRADFESKGSLVSPSMLSYSYCVFLHPFRRLEVDSRLAVEDANSKFYEAFMSGDVKVRLYDPCSSGNKLK